MSPSPAWEPLSPEDLPQLTELAGRIHTSLPERAEVFAEKLALFPAGCRRLTDGRRFLGYAVAHPWSLFTIPPLDHYLGRLPEHPDCLYAHDMAIAPEARGAGASDRCIADWRELADQLGLRAMAGVSVYGTDVHWSRFGFRAVDRPELRRELATYGPTAKYVVWTF